MFLKHNVIERVVYKILNILNNHIIQIRVLHTNIFLLQNRIQITYTNYTKHSENLYQNDKWFF